jgi:hypothetical protein
MAITHQKLADIDTEVLKHLAYSPALTPLDYCLFSDVRKHFKGRKFLSIEEATTKRSFLGWVKEV